jgi:membrane fusion protein, multidrug efflux system
MKTSPAALLALALLALPAAGCSRPDPAAGRPAAPAEVGVVTITSQPVTLTTELPGRVSAFRVAEVRARVNGIVQKRLFTEGGDVKQGQVLFQIDPAPYRVALDSATAQLASAEARRTSARLTAKRTAVLLAGDATSQQSHDDTEAALQAAEADVAAAQAAVSSARINLGYTTVTAPVAGRIGRSEVTEGAYAQAATATRLAVIQQLDPAYVDVTQSSAELMRLRRNLESGKLQSAGAGKAKIALITEDGKEYGQPGTLQFADVTVDPGTGSVALRAIFPNPRTELLPGMYVRARLAEGVSPQALLVPQRGVARDSRGQPTALIVKDGKVELRTLVTERAIADAWLVTDGIAPGDQVIVEGLQRVRPGAPVTAVPAKPASAAGPAGKAGAGT